jgi:hypothetical protein
VADIESASRRIPKATYVPIQLEASTPATGSAIPKFGFVRQLNLQQGEVDAVRKSVATAGMQKIPKFASLLKTLLSFEGSPMPSQLPSPNVFANTPAASLVAFGRALIAVRQQVAAGSPPPAGASRTTGAPVSVAPAGMALHRLNQASVVTNAFEASVSASPIGMLNLERLEMTPAGIERGELIATIPLAPQEETSVTQKEWSVTSREFTSIVTDSLENVSENGVTENTDLAQSTNSQTDHSNQFNVNASVSGSYGFVTVSASTGYTSQDKNSASAKESRDHAIVTTRKASSRVKQEHKMTITSTTVTGTSEATTRTLKNPSATDPMRIDYFSIMRKWRVRLYRYGLRLTYDIAIPEPGGALRKAYRDLAILQQQASAQFKFDLTYDQISTDPNSMFYYQTLGDKYGAQVPPPPSPGPQFTVTGPTDGLADNNDSWHFYTATFPVPEGNVITQIQLVAMMNVNSKGNSDNHGTHTFLILGTDFGDTTGNKIFNQPILAGGKPFLAGNSGSQSITYFIQYAGIAAVTFVVSIDLAPQVKEAWVASVWNALYNAAQTSFYAQQQAISAQIAALQDQINNVDTLTLRREESDEIMKGVLRWLLGTGFDFMPQQVKNVFSEQKNPDGSPVNDLPYGISFTGNDLAISPDSWTTMFQYEEMVKFINEAIEWENVLYFLYSYFWDVPDSWDFIRNISHPDKTRQAFLRSGSARVVLTVRKGYETRWTSFVETGDLKSMLPAGSNPYMTIAQEIQNYDDTNYPGIPPANPGGPALNDAQQVVAACSTKVSATGSAVLLAVDNSDGFLAGATVSIDTAESGLQESQRVTAVPDATHITVQQLNDAHDGTSTPFPIVQQGEQGLLISEWYEYTPTSGTDIAVTSNLTTIA